MSLDLNKLSNKLDETSETLTKFLNDKIMSKNKQDHIGDTNKMVSSVEWLVKELNQKIDFIPMNKWDEIKEVIEKAKAMHKEEIIKARLSLDRSNMSDFPKALNMADDYYNETFGGNNEQQ